MKVTYRHCLQLLKVAEDLKGRGSFRFRCAVAGITMEASNVLARFNEAKSPSKEMQSYQDEIELHTHNCTSEKEGKSVVDVPALVKLIEKTKQTYKKALENAEKDRQTANKSLDESIELCADPIPEEMLEKEDDREKFEVYILSNLYPFVKRA